MTHRQFLLQVIELYHKARKPIFHNSKIKRGRSNSIASAVEDLFAKFLIDKIRCDAIYIDQPISVVGFKSQIYPDLVIVRKNKIIALCDIKMDLGFKRNEFYNFCKKQAKLLNKYRGSKCKIKIRNGLMKEDKYLTIDKKATLNIVIVSNRNINQTILEKHIKDVKNLGSNSGIEVFVLFQGHPNESGYTIGELMKRIKINLLEFSRLIKKLNRN